MCAETPVAWWSMVDLVFEAVQEADGGYCAECLTENIFTQGDTRDELRTNVIQATAAFFFDAPRPERIRLQLFRDEVLSVALKYPVTFRASTLPRLFAAAGSTPGQAGSHIILETEEPFHQRIAVPDRSLVALDPVRSHHSIVAVLGCGGSCSDGESDGGAHGHCDSAADFRRFGARIRSWCWRAGVLWRRARMVNW